MAGSHLFRMELLGSFRLIGPAGERIPIVGKRSRILLAMLATSRSGERSRRWLQERLWGSRERANSQASLRRELSNLRPLVNIAAAPLLVVRHDTVALDLAQIEIDIRDRQTVILSRDEFLEGIDIAWEEGFEDWLRDERQALQSIRESVQEGKSGSRAAGQGTSRQKSELPRIGVAAEEQGAAGGRGSAASELAGVLVERFGYVRWLQVVELSASGESGPGAPEATAQAGQVDYLIRCQTGPAGQARITLAVAPTNRVLWSNSQARDNVVPIVDDDLAIHAVAAIASRVAADQAEQVRDRSIEELSFHELLWRVRWHKRRVTPEDAAQMQAALARAGRERPDSVDLIIEQTDAEIAGLWANGSSSRSLEELRKQIDLARDIDPYDARCWSLMGSVDLWRGSYDGALALHREAVRLDPSYSAGHARFGICHILAGQPIEGMAMIRTSLRLDPHDGWGYRYYGVLALGHIMLGDHAAAIGAAADALARYPDYLYGRVFTVAGHWLGGDQDRALDAVAGLLAVKPDFDPEMLRLLPFKDRSWNERLEQTLAAAVNAFRTVPDSSSARQANSQ